MPAFLTRQQRSTPPDPDRFPTTQLAVLALVRLAEPIALTSIFPYAIKLVQDFHVGNADNAAFLAGILVSAFSLAEAMTGMYWGGLSDRLGRKPVLLFGCLGTLISMLVVGFSVNYWMALVGRALGGMLNGNIGVIQTMVGELVHRPEHEPRAYAIMPFVWSVGTIAGPALGGFFAEPAEIYPETFSRQGVFGKFPFLLPNLICAGLLGLSMFAGYFMLEETHPDMQPWSKPSDLDHSTAETPLVPAGGAVAHAAADLRTESYGTFDQVETHSTEEWAVKASGKTISASDQLVLPEKVFTKRVIMLITALGIFTYHCMTYDHLLPIFLQDKDDRSVSAFSAFVIGGDINGHLGLTVQQCGIIMSVNGLIALFIQGVVFPFMAQWMGVWRLFIVVTIGHPIAYFIVPYLLLLPEGSLYYGIYACLVVRNFFSILQYPLLLILIKEAAPSPVHLGRINGLAASVGAGARTAASPVAGLLWDVGRRIEFTPLAWWSSALIALVGAMQVPFISQKKKTTITTVRPAQCKFGPQEGRERRDSVVHITVQEIRAQLREDA